jgi:tetratricopeptide (TPR) repeat protein
LYEAGPCRPDVDLYDPDSVKAASQARPGRPGAQEGNPDLLYNRGFVLEAAGRYEDAITDYTLALRSADADRSELLYRRGRCLHVLGRAEDAACDLTADLAIGDSPYEKEIGELLAVLPG